MVGEKLNTQALGVVLRARFVPKITTNLVKLPRSTLCRMRRRLRLILAFWQQACLSP
jgi:hypothetical protein